MIAIGIFSSSIAWGIGGFIAGVYIAYLMGLHEKLHVMTIGFSASIAMALLGSKISKYILSITSPNLRDIAFFLFFISGPISVWILFHFVGY